jgi:hypothetical protein
MTPESADKFELVAGDWLKHHEEAGFAGRPVVARGSFIGVGTSVGGHYPRAVLMSSFFKVRRAQRGYHHTYWISVREGEKASGTLRTGRRVWRCPVALGGQDRGF